MVLVLDSIYRGVNTSKLDLTTLSASIIMEREMMLQAIDQNNLSLQAYFSEPLQELADRAQAEEKANKAIFMFSNNRAELFSKLSPSQQQEFLSDVPLVGELQAWKKMVQVNPNAFRQVTPAGISQSDKLTWPDAFKAAQVESTGPGRNSRSFTF